MSTESDPHSFLFHTQRNRETYDSCIFWLVYSLTPSLSKNICLLSHARLNSEHQLHQWPFCCWWVCWFLLFLPDGRGQHIETLYPAVNAELGNNFRVTPRDQKVALMQTLETEPRLGTYFTPARVDITQLKALTHLWRQEYCLSLNCFCIEWTCIHLLKRQIYIPATWVHTHFAYSLFWGLFSW